jgi:hypothetical protein
MKDFIDALVEDIVKDTKDDINNKMQKLMQNIVEDLTTETVRLIDKYYQTYAPIRYVRLHPPRTLRSGKEPTGRSRSKGPSLYRAITRNPNEVLGYMDMMYQDGSPVYIVGLEFDEDDFKGNNMYHAHKGISEWDILEGFLYAGEGKAKGDARSYPTVSHQDYNYDSADAELNMFINNYDTLFDQHFNKIFRKTK